MIKFRVQPHSGLEALFAIRYTPSFAEGYSNLSPLCCKTRARPFIFPHFLSLQGKSEEEVSSAGEQLTSNRIYDGENTNESFLLREALFCCFQCHLWLKKTYLRLPGLIFQ